MYYLLLRDVNDRAQFIDAMENKGVTCVFHYVPLHNSPYGQKVSRKHGDLVNTEKLAGQLLRLPLWLGLEKQQKKVIDLALEMLS